MSAWEEGRDDNVQRSLGRLEGGVKSLAASVQGIIETQQRSDETSAEYRQKMSDKVDNLNDKVDPLHVRMDALELTVKAHEVTLQSYADRELEQQGAAKAKQRFIHIFWTCASAVAITFSDYIKIPLQKLIALVR